MAAHSLRAINESALIAQNGGKTGFTQLPPSLTGITFTNHLSDTLAESNRILENGSGVALGDVDGDGWGDIYLCRLEGSNLLYRNLGHWNFENITPAAGVACPDQFSTGAAFADIDGDGDLDLLVNSIGGGTRSFRNDGKGRFSEDLESGLIRKFGSTSMALADIDGDGDLDLFVANYRTTTIRDGISEDEFRLENVNGKIVVQPEERFAVVMKGNDNFNLVEKGETDFLYLNDGRGHFNPVSWTNGTFSGTEAKPLTAPPRHWGLAAMFRDFTGDNAPDLYVCNDFLDSPDAVWINQGKGQFRALPNLALRNSSWSSM
ncbi:MAG: FG-GAP-like repeat-containing protein, partial [Candidatus Diapherotrites archaeon]|nr:FG-GAP-like repeat-containing protein [Candidatus Diapherotrites archaeon]